MSTWGNDRVSDWGEKKLIRDLLVPTLIGKRALLGVGDDAAVLEIPQGVDLVVSADKIPENLVSYELGLISDFERGRYLAAVNLSDMAAMGASPIALLSVIALPETFGVGRLEELLKGLRVGADEWGIDVVGGDMGWASVESLSAVALGLVPKGRALTRTGARSGHGIFVSGTIGLFGTALAYFALRADNQFLDHTEEAILKRALVWPMPRLDIAQKLLSSGDCTACMDITDGVGQTIVELAEASGVQFCIQMDKLPVDDITRKVCNELGLNYEQVIFGPGLDLELLICGREGLPSEELGLTQIGYVRNGSGAVVLDQQGERPLQAKVWQHFGKSIFALIESARNR